MVIYETKDGFTTAYSDQGYYIHGGYPEADYTQAEDPADLHREYTETDMLIDPPTDEEKVLAWEIISGGAE